MTTKPQPASRGSHPTRLETRRGAATMWLTAAPVWLAAVLGIVAIALWVPDGAGRWLPVAYGACTVLAFALQLTVARVPGAVTRLGWALGGAFVLLALATIGFALAHRA